MDMASHMPTIGICDAYHRICLSSHITIIFNFEQHTLGCETKSFGPLLRRQTGQSRAILTIRIIANVTNARVPRSDGG